MRIQPILMLGLLMLASVAFGNTGTGVELKRDTSIQIIVDASKEAEDLGLTKDYVLSKVELQLRRNGLKPGANKYIFGDFIYINITVFDVAFSWEVAFTRSVSYQVDGKTYTVLARTYSDGGLGTHAGDSEYILNTVLLKGVDVLSNVILKSSK